LGASLRVGLSALAFLFALRTNKKSSNNASIPHAIYVSKFGIYISVLELLSVRDANENPFLWNKKIEVTARCGYRLTRRKN
jgi:hypothetical protein